MKRGEIWTVAGGGGYAGKPRPAVILQSDDFAEIGTLTVCGFTSDPAAAPLIRLSVEPSERNGLRQTCRLMVDKITTVPRSKFGERIGLLSDEDLARLNQALIVFLGLAISPASERRAARTR